VGLITYFDLILQNNRTFCPVIKTGEIFATRLLWIFHNSIFIKTISSMFDQNEFRKYAIKHRGISSNTFDNYAKYINTAIPTGLTPYILEERPMHAQTLDVFSRLMVDRIIFMGEPVNDYVANIVTAQLLFLESADRNRDIQMYLNSPGGSVYAGLGIYDTMQIVNPDIATICTGMAASMAAVLMCAGTSGKRTALQHARIMLHQPSSAIGGQATDIAITVKEIQRVKNNLYSIISEHTGQAI